LADPTLAHRPAQKSLRDVGDRLGRSVSDLARHLRSDRAAPL